MPFILGANEIKDTAYDVGNSCRFDDGSSACMRQTFSGTATAANKLTLSFWIKRSSFQLGTNTQAILNTETGNLEEMIRFEEQDRLHIFTQNSAGAGTSSVKPLFQFRDPAAWYHIVIGIDTTQSTDTDRFKFWVNGSRLTVFTTTSYISQNYTLRLNTAVEHEFGVRKNGAFLDAYIAELVYIDGQQLDADQFGEYDSDSPQIWKPIDVSGLTFGNNGFYCDFADSGDLGDDESGNSNDFTEAGLAATDQTSDTCTNNYAILNPLLQLHSSTFSEGNCKWTPSTASQYYWANSTIGVSQGKWYMEAKLTTAAAHNVIGISNEAPEDNTSFLSGSGGEGDSNVAYQYGYKSSDGETYNNASGSSYGDTYTTGDIIGMYVDLDNNKIYWAKNGTIQNSGTGVDITDPGSIPGGVYFLAVADGTSTNAATWEVNFGNPTFSISSGNADANGYGSFEYDPSSGTFDGASKDFYALNTKNLAEFGG